NVEEWHVECGTVAQVLALPPHSKKVMGLIPAWVAVGSGGQVLQCSGGLSPGPFCVEFACSPRVHKGFPPQEPQQHTLLSIPDQDGRFTSLGPRALKSCPGGRTIRDGEMQKSNSRRLLTLLGFIPMKTIYVLLIQYKKLFSWC